MKARINGELINSGNLIAKQELNGKLILVFRLIPTRDGIEFEGSCKTCQKTVDQISKYTKGTIELF